MNISLKRISALPAVSRRMLTNMNVQKAFIRTTLKHDLQRMQQENDGTLTNRDFDKITSYYGLAVPAVLGEGFSLLRGRRMTHSERYALTYLGALTGLFDDFFDHAHTPHPHIENLIMQPQESLAKTSHELLFVRCWQKVLRIKQSDLLKSYLHQVFHAQVRSTTQRHGMLSIEDLTHITLEKGGLSILFYRCAFDSIMDGHEKAFLYQLGGLGQLENDIFDVYKDCQEHIQTLATSAEHISPLRLRYVTLIEDVKQLLTQTHFAPRHQQKFLHYLMLIYGRGMVCLDHLQATEDRHQGRFTPTLCGREDLVCDMEKLKNRWKLVGYFINAELPGG